MHLYKKVEAKQWSIDQNHDQNHEAFSLHIALIKAMKKLHL